MRILYLIVLTLIYVVQGNAQSIQEAVDMALGYNPTLNARKEAVKAAELAAMSAYLRSLPAVNFDASYRYQSEIAHMDLSQDAPPAISVLFPKVSIGAYNNYEFSLMGRYAVFTGFAESAAIDISRKKQQVSENGLQKSQKEISFNTIVTYRTIQNLNLSLRTLERAKERVVLQLNRVKSLVSQGMALVVDTLSLSLSKMNYEHEVLRVKAEIEKTEQALATLTGQSIQVSAIALNDVRHEIAELDLAAKEEIRILDIQERILQNNKKIKRAGYYPKIGIFAGYKYGRPGPDVVNNQWMDWGVMGASLSWNLFSWGADKRAVEEQEAEIRRISSQRQAVVDQAELSYHNAVRDYQMLRDQLTVKQAALHVAGAKMNIIETRYNEGMETVTEFNDTNLDLTITELSYKMHLVKLLIKINEIDFLSGKPLSNWSIIE